MTAQTTRAMARELKKASKSNDAPIWDRLSKEALKPSISRRVVNLNKVNSLTKDGDAAFVAGKVLGTGTLSHSVTLGSFSISGTAARKVLDAGGSVRSYRDMIEQFPAGTGVILIG